MNGILSHVLLCQSTVIESVLAYSIRDSIHTYIRTYEIFLGCIHIRQKNLNVVHGPMQYLSVFFDASRIAYNIQRNTHVAADELDVYALLNRHRIRLA